MRRELSWNSAFQLSFLGRQLVNHTVAQKIFPVPKLQAIIVCSFQQQQTRLRYLEESCGRTGPLQVLVLPRRTAFTVVIRSLEQFLYNQRKNSCILLFQPMFVWQLPYPNSAFLRKCATDSNYLETCWTNKQPFLVMSFFIRQLHLFLTIAAHSLCLLNRIACFKGYLMYINLISASSALAEESISRHPFELGNTQSSRIMMVRIIGQYLAGILLMAPVPSTRHKTLVTIGTNESKEKACSWGLPALP